jgi:hypothetical protein
MFMMRYDTSGTPVWPVPVQLSSKTIGFVHFPTVVADNAGGAFIAFTTGNPSNASLLDTYVQHIDVNGNLWSTDGTEACNGASTHRDESSLHYDASTNTSWVLMQELDLSQAHSGITLQRFDPAGNQLLGTTGFDVVPITGIINEPFELRQSDNGVIIIVYVQRDINNNYLTAIMLDSTGAPYGLPNTHLLCAAGTDRYNVTVTSYWSDGTDGQVVAVWEDLRNDRGIYAQNISTNGITGPLFTGITSPKAPFLNASIYPNPSTFLPRLKISSENSNTVVVLVIDETGKQTGVATRLPLHAGVNETDLKSLLQINDLTAGRYSLIINNNDQRTTIPFTLIR